MPFEGDFFNEKQGFLEKYIMRVADVPAENVHRCFRCRRMVASCSSSASTRRRLPDNGRNCRLPDDFEDKKKVAEYLRA